ncbi:type II secretion system protein GspG [Pseudoalteromonas luteoviolacea]|uniref:type II secretion system protein GspG n=1 Tax=Pseudoalteromonas luteoviolacea TaxID=43657 RepID=UPI001B38CCF1|nr:type II secretion system protein GspG [Pseudoalteromonas luteoviolacea]MBQ4835719.1 type II secretion system protein GspG [Pseudoalteromonas luteoviolacea]
MIKNRVCWAFGALHIAGLALIVMPQLMSKHHYYRVSKEALDIAALEAAIKMYYTTHQTYPHTLSDLIESKVGIIESIPIDSWGNEYKYNNPAKVSNKRFEVISLGADNKIGGEGDNRDIFLSN